MIISCLEALAFELISEDAFLLLETVPCEPLSECRCGRGHSLVVMARATRSPARVGNPTDSHAEWALAAGRCAEPPTTGTVNSVIG